LQRVADIEFVNNNNANSTGIGVSMVSIDTLVFFNLHGLRDDELEEILKFRSFTHTSWKKGKVTEYFVFNCGIRKDSKVIWCYSGFSPILIRLLQNKYGYLINGKELYRAREIEKLPDMKYKLWDFQRDAVEAWIKSGCYGILQCPTSAGKSIIGCSIIKKMNTRTIILCHTSDLLINVWYNYLLEQFGDEIRNRIGIIGGGLSKKDRKLMRLEDDNFMANLRKDIVICTSQSLLAKNKLVMVGEEKFGLMIVDEIHHYSSDQFKRVAGAIRAAYRCGLTATLRRPDNLSPIFHALIGDVRYKIGIRDLIKKGLIVEPIFYSIIVDDDIACNKIRTCKYKLLEYSRYVKKVSASSKLKFNYILGLCESLKSKGRKFMLYTDFVNKSDTDENGKLLEFNTSQDNIYTRDDYVYELRRLGLRVIGISSEMSGVQRQTIFKKIGNGELDGIIFGALGNEGISIPAIDAVITCNSTASPIKFPQRVGRGMRLFKGKKNCYIYEILLNVPKELQWSNTNFIEYEEQGFVKEQIFVNNDGYQIKNNNQLIKQSTNQTIN
jgi:superfamily II DNA or RNA helicase